MNAENYSECDGTIKKLY